MIRKACKWARRTNLSLLCVLPLVAVACGADARSARTLPINEFRGSVGGVGIGDSVEAMWRVFGKRSQSSGNEPQGPLEDDDYVGPTYARVPEPAFRYRYISFSTSKGKIVKFMVIRRARTSRGLSIGDPLEKAESVYHLQCGTANANTEYRKYPACMGRIGRARLYLWVGGDPIQNITISARELGDVG